MTRIRSQHEFNEVTVHDPESVCPKCGNTISQTCKICGLCMYCHEQVAEREY
ncbi:MAG: hypothetical protein WCB31_07810 [Nitrososphaeraceae archaeon]